jgi:outer membrane protein
MRRQLLHISLACLVVCMSASAQSNKTVTLEDAQAVALKNHPHIAAEVFAAEAGAAVVKEAHSAYLPTISLNVTGVGTDPGSVLSAGSVTTSSIYNRAASGVAATELLSDFGRTASLEKSAKLRNAAANQDVATARAQVVLNVRLTYYQALASQSILKVARDTLELRRVTLRQVSAQAQSALRSTVDVSFAQVNVSQAELDLVNAENGATASHAQLSAAMGYVGDQSFSLSDEPMPTPLCSDVDALIAQSMRQRPDLNALQLSYQATQKFAVAEKDLRNPTLTASAVAGAAPLRADGLPETYAAAGVNLNVPVFNGGLFKARRQEAEARAAAANKDIDELSVEIARDVKIAWLNAEDAFKRLDVTARMVAQANEALRLAQARYQASLGSIVELNQAQVNQTSAEIASASAKYDYLGRRGALDYAMGNLP